MTITREMVFKQRRLLLSLSFALTAIHALDVKLSGNVTAQGLVLEFQYPLAIVVAMWISWAWAYWRYWQYESSLYDSARDHARRLILGTEIVNAVQSVIQKAVRRGDYASRGVNSSEKITVSSRDKSGHDLWPEKDSAKEWLFPNVGFYKGNSDSNLEEVKGGANCVLDGKAVAKVQRRTDRRFITRNPAFADYRAPYVLALSAPAAAAYDLVRRLIDGCVS